MEPTETKPIYVPPGNSSNGKVFDVFGDHLTVKLAGEEVSDRYCILESTTEPGAGPPMHVHHRENESFYVLEGEFEFHIGGRVVHAAAGSFLFGPRHIPHRFQNVGLTRGRLLIVAEPAGVEHFFAELSHAFVGGHPNMDRVGELCQKYEIEFVR
jgi:mannose-6-phosphate isomerase-like protein (cupin superfamily)